MTSNELRRLFPNHPESFIRRNSDSSEAQSPKPEPIVRDEPVAEKNGEDRNSTRLHVRVTSYRRKLIDPDNLCPKYFIDCLRMAEYISDDSAKDITLQVEQFKVKTSGEERTEIEISPAAVTIG